MAHFIKINSLESIISLFKSKKNMALENIIKKTKNVLKAGLLSAAILANTGCETTDITYPENDQWQESVIFTENFNYNLNNWNIHDPNGFIGIAEYEGSIFEEASGIGYHPFANWLGYCQNDDIMTENGFSSITTSNPIYLQQLQSDMEDKLELELDALGYHYPGMHEQIGDFLSVSISEDQNVWSTLYNEHARNICDNGSLRPSSAEKLVLDISGWQDKYVYLRFGFEVSEEHSSEYSLIFLDNLKVSRKYIE